MKGMFAVLTTLGLPQARQSYAPNRRKPTFAPFKPLRSRRTRLPVSTLTFAQRLQQQLSGAYAIPVNWLAVANFLALVAFMLISITVVYYSYEGRQQVSELAQLQQERDYLQQKGSYLSRDQNELSEFSRIENTAIQELGMRRPAKQDIVIFKYDR